MQVFKSAFMQHWISNRGMYSLFLLSFPRLLHPRNIRLLTDCIKKQKCSWSSFHCTLVPCFLIPQSSKKYQKNQKTRRGKPKSWCGRWSVCISLYPCSPLYIYIYIYINKNKKLKTGTYHHPSFSIFPPSTFWVFQSFKTKIVFTQFVW